MRSMTRALVIRSVMTMMLLVTSALSVAAHAAPIARGSVRDASQDEDTLEPERQPAIVGDVVQEVRRTGLGVSPSLIGIDDGFLTNGTLLYSELRGQDFNILGGSSRAASVKSADGGSDIFWDILDSALRSTRDALFFDGDTANFSAAGIELSVTLRGDRRGVSINGFDLLPSQDTLLVNDAWQPVAATPVVVSSSEDEAQVGYQAYQTSREGDVRITLANIRRLFFHPIVIISVIAALGIWVVLIVADASRRQ